MRFEEVVDFPNEREAYMIVRDVLGLSEEEYLKLSWIERKELAEAYRIAKRLGVERQDTLQELYGDTHMFDDGIYNLAAATMIIKEKAGILSIARTKLGLEDSIEKFVLKGNDETNKIAIEVRKAVGDNLDEIVEHLRALLFSIDGDNLVEEKISSSRFEFEDKSVYEKLDNEIA